MEYHKTERRLLKQLEKGKRPIRPERPEGVADRGFDVVTGLPSEVPDTCRIRASALAAILMNPDAEELGAIARGLHIEGYWIDGDLDLASAHRLDTDSGRAVVPLIAENCRIDGVVNLAGTRSASLSFAGTRLHGLTARGGDIAGGLSLKACVVDPVPEADPANPNKHMRRAGDPLRDEHGRIDLDGCVIGGDLDARDLRVAAMSTDTPPHLEVDADNSVIRGSVDFSTRAGARAVPDDPAPQGGCQPALYANFDNAEIFGDFKGSHAVFATLSEGSSGKPAEALDLRGAQIRGDLNLNHIRTTGLIRLEDADVAQDLELGGACLSSPKGVALDAPGLVVHGSVHLVDRARTKTPAGRGSGTAASGEPDPRLLAFGQLRFARARIGGDFDASGATICAVDVSIEGVALDLRSVEFGGSVYLDARRDVGPGFFVGLINMIQTRVGGSIVLSGSWFRAPCGQMMGPERIDAELYSESEMQLELANRGIDADSPQYRDFSIEDVYYGYEHGFWHEHLRSMGGLAAEIGLHPPKPEDRKRQEEEAPHSPAHALLLQLGILKGLYYEPRDLWRLRGGCRAIALEDAKIAGAVLFGTSIDIHPCADARQTGEGAGRNAQDPRNLTNGPSVVVGCVDMDRIQVDGELRLTGGIFRAVTPVVSSVGITAEDARPTDNNPDPGLSYPSTVGWTELKARSCLTLRGARIAGRLDTRFFGAIPETAVKLGHLDRASLEQWRASLNLVPAAGSSGAIDADLDPRNYADEMLFMIALASWVEALGDRQLGATHPHVPPVQEQPGGYHLRPDGLFDLRDATIRAIHDHPCHGWPTSDGHVQLNGCRYDFLLLEPEESRPHPASVLDWEGHPGDEKVVPGNPDVSPRKGAARARDSRVYSRLRYRERHNVSYLEWRLRGVGAFFERCGYRLRRLGTSLLLLVTLTYWNRRAQRPIIVRGETESLAQSRHRRWLELCMASRASRYRRYAQRSFWARNNDSLPSHMRRIAWLEQQYHGADPTPHDFLPQPYENLCRIMRSNGYREDADHVAAAKRLQRTRAALITYDTLFNPITLIRQAALFLGEYFLRITSNYGYSPVRIVLWIIAVILFGAAHLQIALKHNLLAFESLQTEGVAVYNTVQNDDRPPAEDLVLDPGLLAIDGFIPLVEFGYAAEWTVAEWRQSSDEAGRPEYEPLAAVPGEPDAQPAWPAAVRSLMTFDCESLWPPNLPSWDGSFAFTGEVLRIPTAAVAWPVGMFLALIEGDGSDEADENGNRTDETDRPSFGDRSIEAIQRLNPENTLRWLGAIYHGVGWALISMAIVTFTGVMRRD
jgi:hypothetical protein